jgi:hypothetical protein
MRAGGSRTRQITFVLVSSANRDVAGQVVSYPPAG